MYGLGKCENKDCVQINCERLNEIGSVYDFKQICKVENDWKWFEGKDKKSSENIIELDELVENKSDGQE